jgi:hypothetical protein
MSGPQHDDFAFGGVHVVMLGALLGVIALAALCGITDRDDFSFRQPVLGEASLSRIFQACPRSFHATAAEETIPETERTRKPRSRTPITGLRSGSSGCVKSHPPYASAPPPDRGRATFYPASVPEVALEPRSYGEATATAERQRKALRASNTGTDRLAEERLIVLHLRARVTPPNVRDAVLNHIAPRAESFGVAAETSSSDRVVEHPQFALELVFPLWNVPQLLVNLARHQIPIHRLISVGSGDN